MESWGSGRLGLELELGLGLELEIGLGRLGLRVGVRERWVGME